MIHAFIFLCGITIGWHLNSNFKAHRKADRRYQVAKLDALFHANEK